MVEAANIAVGHPRVTLKSGLGFEFAPARGPEFDAFVADFCEFGYYHKEPVHA
mgnify:CR=1 FL=1